MGVDRLEIAIERVNTIARLRDYFRNEVAPPPAVVVRTGTVGLGRPRKTAPDQLECILYEDGVELESELQSNLRVDLARRVQQTDQCARGIKRHHTNHQRRYGNGNLPVCIRVVKKCKSAGVRSIPRGEHARKCEKKQSNVGG